MLACVAAIPLCATYLPGVHMINLQDALILGAILGLIHIFLRPIIKLLTSVFNFLTLGLLSILIDGWLIIVACDYLPNSITVDSFLWAIAISFVINLLYSLLSAMLKG